jgi:catechol 2,3-dioxygenase-like lactoylglutathione lyase family enzyme
MLSRYTAFPMIAVKNLVKARKFYEHTVGLSPLSPKEDEHVAMYESGIGRIAVYVSEYAGTNRATAASWEVEDVEAEVEALKARGVMFEHYELPGTTRKGDVHVAGSLKNAWFKDPEGNILGIVGR